MCLAYEWPLRWVAGSNLHRSMVARLLWLPLATLSAVLLYQTTNAALYYVIGCGVYFWAYSEGEVGFVPGCSMAFFFVGAGVLTWWRMTGYLCCSLDSAEKIGSEDQSGGRYMTWSLMMMIPLYVASSIA